MIEVLRLDGGDVMSVRWDSTDLVDPGAAFLVREAVGFSAALLSSLRGLSGDIERCAAARSAQRRPGRLACPQGCVSFGELGSNALTRQGELGSFAGFLEG